MSDTARNARRHLVENLLPLPDGSLASSSRRSRIAAVSAPTRCTTCPVRQVGFCHTLSKRLHARVAHAAVPVTQAADHWYWDEKPTPHFVGIVRDGYLRMPRYSAGGRRMITAIAGPGGIVGEVTNGRSGFGLETSTPVSMCTIDHGTFNRLMSEEPRLRRAVRAEQRRSLDVLRRHIWSRGIQTPEERLSGFLIQACDVMHTKRLPGGADLLTLDIPRADIADLLGTSRESISRITRQWQANGLIDIPDARHFILQDRRKLIEMSGLVRTPRLPVAMGRDAGSHHVDAPEPPKVTGRVFTVGRAGWTSVAASLRRRRRRKLSYL